MNFTTIFLITAGVVALLLFAAVVGVFLYRKKTFIPTSDKQKQLENLNQDLFPSGFAYSPYGDYFYALIDCWQRKAGYCRLYDEGAAAFNMVMDCEPVTFSYAGKRWLIELWKGQYGLTTGAEVGIYSTSRSDISADRFHGTFYESVSNYDMLPISFILKKNGKVLIRRSGIHWWLTGFKLGEFSDPSDLTLDVKIKFRERGMCRAFCEALEKLGYRRGEVSVLGNLVSLHFSSPHTKQPLPQKGLTAATAQELNKKNCRIFKEATKDYCDAPDKLEYLKAMFPGLYHFFLKSLYSKAFFDVFSWLLELIFGKSPEPSPCPPVNPCPPEPPTPPCPPVDPCPPEPPTPPCPPVDPCPPEPPTPPCCSCRPHSCNPCDRSCSVNHGSCHNERNNSAPEKNSDNSENLCGLTPEKIKSKNRRENTIPEPPIFNPESAFWDD